MAVGTAKHFRKLGENIQPAVPGSVILRVQSIIAVSALTPSGVDQVLYFRPVIPAHQKNNRHSDPLGIHAPDRVLVGGELILHGERISSAVCIRNAWIQYQIQEHMAYAQLRRSGVHGVIGLLKAFFGVVPVKNAGIKWHEITAVPDRRISVFIFCHIRFPGIKVRVLGTVICGHGHRREPDAQKEKRQKKPLFFMSYIPSSE